jgi:hypothetical protein
MVPVADMGGVTGEGSPLAAVLREVEEFVADGGWDQPARLFALVPTGELLAREPRLVGVVAGEDADGLTPVEQEELPEYATLEELLAGIAWPPGVAGAALAVERLMLPADAEPDLPSDEEAALDAVASHPGRQEVRLAVAVLRDGSREAALRFRAHDNDDEVLHGPDLVPGLADALAATLEP